MPWRKQLGSRGESQEAEFLGRLFHKIQNNVSMLVANCCYFDMSRKHFYCISQGGQICHFRAVLCRVLIIVVAQSVPHKEWKHIAEEAACHSQPSMIRVLYSPYPGGYVYHAG